MELHGRDRQESGDAKRGQRGRADAKPACTVMIRNLPNRTTLDRLQQHFVSLNCSDYESIYMPVDSRTGMNKGYAFVHFDKPQSVDFFTRMIEGSQLLNSQSTKTLSVSEATHQGRARKTHKFSSQQVWTAPSSGRVWIR